MTNLIQTFVLEGAHLNCSVADIREKLSNVKVFLFDWDGVFNAGVKYGDQGSPFAEADSMGTNLLRLGYWLDHNGTMPITGVLTGAVNQGVEYFVNRERFDVCMRGFNNKQVAWSEFLDAFNVKPEEVAYVFDDVIDLPIAQVCGLRFCVNRRSSPAFRQYVIDKNLCDYITSNEGGQGAVREVCEFLLAVMDRYEDAVRVRTEYGVGEYLEYLNTRQQITPKVMLAEGIN